MSRHGVRAAHRTPRERNHAAQRRKIAGYTRITSAKEIAVPSPCRRQVVSVPSRGWPLEGGDLKIANLNTLDSRGCMVDMTKARKLREQNAQISPEQARYSTYEYLYCPLKVHRLSFAFPFAPPERYVQQNRISPGWATPTANARTTAVPLPPP